MLVISRCEYLLSDATVSSKIQIDGSNLFTPERQFVDVVSLFPHAQVVVTQQTINPARVIV